MGFEKNLTAVLAMVVVMMVVLMEGGGGGLMGVEAKTYTIGILADPTDLGDLQSRAAIDVALEDFSKSDEAPKDDDFKLKFRPSSTTEESNAGAKKFGEDKDVIAVLGPTYSSQSLVAGVTLSNEELPTISFAATSTSLADKGIYSFFTRSIPSDAQQAIAMVDIVYDTFRWRDVAILSATDAYSLGLTQTFISEARVRGINLLSTDYFALDDVNFEDELLNIRRTGARIIVAVMQIPEFQIMLKQAIKFEMTGPPYVYLTPDAISGLSAVQNADGSVNKKLLEAWEGSLAINPFIGNPDTKEFKEFEKNLKKRLKERKEEELGGSILQYTTYAYDAAMTVLKAASKLLKQGKDIRNGKALLEMMKKQKFDGLSGRVQYDSGGERIRSSYALSNVRAKNGKGELVPVGRWTNETGLKLTKDPIWPTGKTRPIPDSTPRTTIWYYDCYNQERLVDTRGYVVLDSVDGDPVFIDDKSYCDSVIDCNNWSDEGFNCDTSLAIAYIALGILAVVLILIVAGSMAIIWYYRKAGRVRASGLFFLMAIGASSIVGILAIFSLYGKAHTYVCVIQIWILSIPSAVMIGALATKQYRVWKVFGNKTLKTVIVTEKQLFFMTLGFLVPDLIVLIIWSAADTPKREFTNGHRHVECGNDYEEVFLIILAVYKGFLLFVSSVLAILTRKMPSAFSEAKLVGFALYNATLVSAIVIPIIIVLDDDDFFSWILTELFILFFFFSTFAILAFPKVYGLLVVDRKKSSTDRNKLPTYIKEGSGSTATSNKTM